MKIPVKISFESNCESILCDDFILVCGGQDKTLFCYIASTYEIGMKSSPFTCERRGDLNSPRVDHSLVKTQGLVFCIGGYSGNYMKSVEYYNKGKWENAPELPLNAGNISSVYMQANGTIYAFGGRNGSGSIGDIQTLKLDNGLLDPKSEWDVLEVSLPKNCNFFAAASYNDKILIFGGGLKFSGLWFDVQKQDFIKEELKLPEEPCRLKRNCCLSLGKGIYAITYQTCKMLCFVDDEWEVLTSKEWTGEQLSIDSQTTIASS